MAAEAGIEKAGSSNFVNRQQELFAKGFSFSGYERDLCCLNLGTGKYLNISGVTGIDSISDGRGAVFADFDNDGDLDVFLTTIQGHSRLLFRNQVGQDSASLRLTLEGRRSGRDAYGATVRVKTTAGILTKVKSAGSGFLAQSDPRLLFGLGQDQMAEWVEVTWPSGGRQRLGPLPARSSWLVVEGEAEPRRLEEEATSLPDPRSEEDAALANVRPRRGEAFPRLDVLSLDGRPGTLLVTAAGGGTGPRYTLVNLWATWCSNCRREIPEIVALRERLGPETLRVVGLSIDGPDAIDKVRRFVDQHALPYEVEMLGAEGIASIYKNDMVSVPLSFLLDGSGMIVDAFAGWTPDIQQRLEATLGTE